VFPSCIYECVLIDTVMETDINKQNIHIVTNMKSIEYHDSFQNVLNMDSNKQLLWNGKRQQLTEKYSWAIPNQKSIDYIVDCSPLIEIGAGSGYWGYEIDKHGGDITCYDSDPNSWDTQWYPVQEGTPHKLQNANISDDFTLFLCWPPANNPMAYNAITMLNPNDVIFIGEWSPNKHSETHVNGTDEFYEEMSTWNRVKTISIPQWEKSTDKLYHFSQ